MSRQFYAHRMTAAAALLITAVSLLGWLPAPVAAAPSVMDVPGIVARVLPAVVSITTRHIHREAGQGLRCDAASGPATLLTLVMFPILVWAYV